MSSHSALTYMSKWPQQYITLVKAPIIDSLNHSTATVSTVQASTTTEAATLYALVHTSWHHRSENNMKWCLFFSERAVWDGNARTITKTTAGLKLSSRLVCLVKCTPGETHVIFSSALSEKWRLHVVRLRITYCDVLRCCFVFPSGCMLSVLLTVLKQDTVSLVSTVQFTSPTNNHLAYFFFQ